MSETAYSISEAIQRFKRRDHTFKVIYLWNIQHTDEQLVELIDCLLAHPNVVTGLYLGRNQMTDETGVKLARYIAISSTIQELNLEHNQLGEATYLAFAAALRVNSSLRYLYLYYNQEVDRSRVDAAFVDTLLLNPNRYIYSHWRFYPYEYGYGDSYKRLKLEAERLGHPNMQALLANDLFRNELVRI